ncbi:hypothetical protein DPMN_111355 [Dreissena polymorpha]|uniref:Uncharacterized protein n=1 Tax=Dreissena polymorpha TaxID=45954 RepID=A0A9D4KE44_DREPO|nr:hypothetical protein DPMN_111355 [Dreissena polymorpha]
MAELCTDNQCIQVDPVSWSYPRNVNATVTYTCTSLLSGFSSIFSYCPVRTCQTDYHWTNSSLSCGGGACISHICCVYMRALEPVCECVRACVFTKYVKIHQTASINKVVF